MNEAWEKRFFNRAFEVAQWSKDPSTKVGACVTSEKRVISEGFNGFPPGIEDLPHRYRDRDLKIQMVLHAEQNALWFAKGDTEGRYLFCTHAPCPKCASEIIRSGIKTLVTPEPQETFSDRWNGELTSDMLFEAGVKWKVRNV